MTWAVLRGVTVSTQEHIEGFKNVNVAVFGDLMLDEYVQGDALRLSPEAPVPVILAKDVVYALGGAGNVAANIRSLGGQATLSGILGNDNTGGIFERRASQLGIHTRCYGESAQTTRKVRIMGQRDHPYLRLDYEMPPALVELPPIDMLIGPRTHVVVVSDYNKGAISAALCAGIVERCAELRVPSLIDPKPGSAAVSDYAGCFLLKPNRIEAEQLTKTSLDSDLAINRAGLWLSTRFRCHVLITLGSEGMRLFKRGTTEPIHFAGPVVPVSNVTGAGDTVSATLALAIGSGMSLEDACKLAGTAARICVSKPGTVAVQGDELLREVCVVNETQKVFTDEGALLPRLRHRDKRIVMANGCFDLFHAGHVDLLTQARSMGDFLIVALNSDESVRQLKGDSRPINTWEHRASVLASLAVVDAVVPFFETSPAALFERFKPNVVVHGEDGRETGAAERAVVEKHGGQTVYIQRRLDVSSTQILSRL